MRKILLATTALAAVSMASSAFAMGADAKFTGSYDFGWMSISDDFKGPGDSDQTYGAGGVTITAESTGDNGLTYGMKGGIDFQDNTHSRDNGRAGSRDSGSTFIYVKGDFGEVSFGHQGNARGGFGVGSPTHAGGYGGADIRSPIRARWLEDNDTANNHVDDSTVTTDLVYAPHDIGGNDDAKVKYVSPSFSGFQFGADVQDSDSEGNEMSVGASFTTDIAGGSLKIAGNNHSNDMEGDAKKEAGNHLGVSFSQGAFTVTAGTYSGDKPRGDVKTERESTAFGLGFKVSDGFDVAASYTNAENTGTGIKEEGSFQSVTGSYTIAPGLKTQLGISQFEVNDKNDATRDNEGSSVTWELKFSF